MSTDQTFEATVKQVVEPIVVQPAPRIKRKSSVFGRLRQKKAKAQNILSAFKFAQVLFQGGTNVKVAVKSIKLQHGISTRKAREIFHAQKLKRHRRRS